MSMTETTKRAPTIACLLNASFKRRAPKDGDSHTPKVIVDTNNPYNQNGDHDPMADLASIKHAFGEHGGVNMSIEASATFTVMEPETMHRMFTGELGPDKDYYIYSRHFNPTVINLGRLIAAMEGTEAAYCTASGMSAVSTVILQLVGTGGHIVASHTLYGGTHALLTHFLPRKCGISTTFVDIKDHAEVEAAIQVGKTKLLYFESISNPTLTVSDIPALSKIAHDKGIVVVVDNTFAPMVISPARLGADVIIHSISKYISGGADIIAGIYILYPQIIILDHFIIKVIDYY